MGWCQLETNIILLIILAISIIGKADSVSVAIALLLIVRLLHIETFIFPLLEKKGCFVD